MTLEEERSERQESWEALWHEWSFERRQSVRMERTLRSLAQGGSEEAARTLHAVERERADRNRIMARPKGPWTAEARQRQAARTRASWTPERRQRWADQMRAWRETRQEEGRDNG